MLTTYLSKEQQRVARVKRFLGGAIAEQSICRKDLAKDTGMKYQTLLKRLNQPETCTLGELWIILDALNVPEEERGKLV